MKIQVSVSTSGFKKGDRVVVRIKKNEWYLGQVVRGGQKLDIDFDDGHEALVEGADLKHVKLVISKIKKTKTALNDEAAKVLYTVPVEKKQIGKHKTALIPVKEKKPVEKSGGGGGDSIELDRELELLPEQQKVLAWASRTPLQKYLEGDAVKSDWIERMSDRRSKIQPKKLYRTVIVSEGAKIGTTINVDKKLMSASDEVANCIFAACSYHNDYATNRVGKQLVVVEIHNPKCVMTLREILECQHKAMSHIVSRIRDEREFLITGEYKAKVIYLVRREVVYGEYAQFHEMSAKNFLAYSTRTDM